MSHYEDNPRQNPLASMTPDGRKVLMVSVKKQAWRWLIEKIKAVVCKKK